jgi:NADH:ubiquinone reductase (H+-translocating)
VAARRILVLGGGFAGLWSAIGAARKRQELGLSESELAITLVNRDRFHSLRVRNYEADLPPCRVPLAAVLDPVGVEWQVGEVAGIDPGARGVDFSGADGVGRFHYDRLVFALGSQLRRPSIPGLAAFGFDIDTTDAAERLQAHLERLTTGATVLVVGAGLTGLEIAAELPTRLGGRVRVILADHNPTLASAMGPTAQPVIASALAALGVETRSGVSIVAADAGGVTLASGERIEASTVIWCAGMEAQPLTGSFGVPLDPLGRLPVDSFLKVKGQPAVFAAGDGALLQVDPGHDSVMSCQHARPMGRFAGHNVVADLVGVPLLPLAIPWYVTVLDLGPWGAVYTEGWQRQLVAQGAEAKVTKRTINHERIVPPLDGDREAILAAAAPVVQQAPARG